MRRGGGERRRERRKKDLWRVEEGWERGKATNGGREEYLPTTFCPLPFLLPTYTCNYLST